MSITSPPRPPRQSRPSGLIERGELEALVEALIEEARQRARRRRRRNGAYILLAVLVGGGLYFGLDRGGGSTAAAPAVRTSNGGTAAAAQDLGERWGLSHGPNGGPAYALAVAPSASGDVYVGTSHGVFRSTNGGRSWRSAGLARTTALEQRRNLPTSPDSVPGVTSLVVDPHAPTTVYAGLNGHWVGSMTYGEAVYKTTDGGQTWRALALRGQPVAISPAGRPTVYAATGGPAGMSRLVRSTDGARSWQPADLGLPSTYLWGLAFDPSMPETVYAAMGKRGVFESNDGGARWRAVGMSVRYGEVTSIAVDPSHPRTVFAGTDAGVAISGDSGRSWRMLNATMGVHGRDRWIGQVTALLVDPRDSRTLYASTRCTGIYKSTDGGRKWSPSNAGLKPRCGPWTYSVALDPRAPQTIYAADATRGVFKSIDGARWQVANQGLSLTTVSALTVDPQRPRTVYAGTRALGLFESADGGVHWQRAVGPGLGLIIGVALDPSDPRNVLVAGAPNGIARSTDAGRTWTDVAFGQGHATVVAISGKTAYAGASGGHLFGSTDGGRSWRPLGHLGVVQALAIGPGDPAVVYAAIAGAGTSTAGGLYKSIDGGRSWQRLTTIDVTVVALDPDHPGTVYVGTGEGAVYKSTDGGTTWQRESTGLETAGREAIGVIALVVDPTHLSTLYAATGPGVFRSTDAGKSWHSLNAGLPDLDVTTLALDATGRTLYAGTAGGGVVKLRRNP